MGSGKTEPEEDHIFKPPESPHFQTAADILRQVHIHAGRIGVDISVTPHTFRRSCATEMIRVGANLYHVKDLLGYETLDTLRHYAKLNVDDLRKTLARCHPRERGYQAQP